MKKASDLFSEAIVNFPAVSAVPVGELVTVSASGRSISIPSNSKLLFVFCQTTDYALQETYFVGYASGRIRLR